jgi:hypothetical protein
MKKKITYKKREVVIDVALNAVQFRHRPLSTTRLQSILSIRGLKRMDGKNTAKFLTCI